MSNITIPVPAVGFTPPVYYCRRAVKPFVLTGSLDKAFWKDAPFTEDFIDIEGRHMPLPRFVTQAKMLWDDENLYFGAILNGDEIWGSIEKRDDVIFYDNDFEIFIEPDSDTRNYYEFEMNVRNTVWDLFLPQAYRDGGSALTGFDIKGLRTAVHVEGDINVVSDQNHFWSVEVVIPFASITESCRKKKPETGDYYRVNFSRVQWKVDTTDGIYRKRTDPVSGLPLPEDNWVWAPTGVINIHYPELWSFVFFVDQETDTATLQIPENECRKWELRKLYYAQHISRELYGSYSDSLEKLKEILRTHAPNEYNRSLRELDYQIELTSQTFLITCSGEGEGTLLIQHSDGNICLLNSSQSTHPTSS